jgi:hypothetical protein
VLATVTDNAASLAEELSHWLSSGRLQSAEGAFCAWLDTSSGRLAFAFPEITGYALTWLARYEGQDGPATQAGHRAAGWLVDRLRSGDRSARSGYDQEAVYTFDLGMIAAGLISFGRCTGTPEYVDQGAQVAEQLAMLIRQAGELPAIAPDGLGSERPPEWSTVGRVHLAKCAQALLLADEVETAVRLCELALADQHEEGWFRTAPGDTIMLHPLLYAVEGLWITALATGQARLLDAAADAARWVWRHQLPSGGLPRSVSGSGVGAEQIDVTTQAIRAAVLLDIDCPGLDAAVCRVLSLASPDHGYGQALIYQPGGEGSDHLNAWVTMFGEQALRLVAHGADALRWNTIV